MAQLALFEGSHLPRTAAREALSRGNLDGAYSQLARVADATEEAADAARLERIGQGVLLLFAAANRDERDVPDPDRFDVGRNPRRILSFGHAAHVCLGAHVARLEGRVVLEEILARFPGYRLDESRLVYRRADQIQGLVSAPIQVS